MQARQCLAALAALGLAHVDVSALTPPSESDGPVRLLNCVVSPGGALEAEVDNQSDDAMSCNIRCNYEFGDKTACFLYPTPNAGTSRASQAFWQVGDVEREVAELKARGVEFENYDMPGEKSPSGVVTAGGAKAAWFKDSEGNILAIIQYA